MFAKTNDYYIMPIDPEKQQLTLNIANEHIRTTIFRKDEATLKDVEKQVNSLWKQWRMSNPMKTDSEVLAMVAFQYAKLYYDILSESEKREKELLDFISKHEEKLNRILLDV